MVQNNLKSHVEINSMGNTLWFLGQHYNWHTDQDGKVLYHISQQAFIKQMIERFKLEHCTTAQIPYRSGLKIDCIEHNNKPRSEKEHFIQKYQSIIGCLNWLSINTLPDINTTYSLLSQFNSNPSPGHMEAAKYVLRYLKHTLSHYIWFKQGENRLQGCCTIPKELRGDKLLLFTYLNWGTQDASKPVPNKT